MSGSITLLDFVSAQAGVSADVIQKSLEGGGYGLASLALAVAVYFYRGREGERVASLEATKVASKEHEQLILKLTEDFAKAILAKDAQLATLRDAKDKEIADLNRAIVGMVEGQTRTMVESNGMFRRAEELFTRVAQHLNSNT